MFLIAIPMEENDLPFTLSAYNDEKAHLNYILQLAEYDVRPVQTHSVSESYPAGQYDYEYYQSPLYYRISAWIYTALPENFRTVAILRFVNLIFGMMLILTVGRIMLMFSSRLSSGGMIFMSVFAPLVLFSVTLTNDVLLWLLSALLTYYCLRFLEYPALRYRMAISLAFSAAVWTKVSVLALTPAVLFTLYRGSSSSKTFAKISAIVVFVLSTIVLTFPLLVENHLYYGSIIPLSVGSGQPIPLSESLSARSVYLTANYMLNTFYFPFNNYWRGIAHSLIISIMGMVSLVIIFHAVKQFLRNLKDHHSSLRDAQIFLMTTLIFATMGTLWMSFRYHQGEARMSFIALPAIVYFVLAGSEKMLGKMSPLLLKFSILFPSLPYLIMLIH